MNAGDATVITDYGPVREALRSKALRQGLHDEGHTVDEILRNGGRADPDNHRTDGSTTERKHFSAYPVLFTPRETP